MGRSNVAPPKVGLLCDSASTITYPICPCRVLGGPIGNPPVAVTSGLAVVAQIELTGLAASPFARIEPDRLCRPIWYGPVSDLGLGRLLRRPEEDSVDPEGNRHREERNG